MRHIVTFVAVLTVLGARYPASAFPVQISLKAGCGNLNQPNGQN
jgi:hypothetical protein